MNVDEARELTRKANSETAHKRIVDQIRSRASKGYNFANIGWLRKSSTAYISAVEQLKMDGFKVESTLSGVWVEW